MKRGREEETREIETLGMAKCLMLLSKFGETDHESVNKDTSGDRVFVCKTCNREFSSFQALGGHRASHKKPKLGGDFVGLKIKPKTHECSICRIEFPIGQALGGHMRRHRQEVKKHVDVKTLILPVLKKSNSCKRVVCLDLDLHLGFAPPEDDLKLSLKTPTLIVS